METKVCVVVLKHLASSVRQKLKKADFFDSSSKVTQLSDNRVAIPLSSKDVTLTKNDLHCLEDISYEIQQINVSKSKKACFQNPYTKIMNICKEYISKQGLEWNDCLESDVPKQWEKHGDLILLSSNTFDNPAWNSECFLRSIADCLKVKRIAKKSAIKNDDYRSPCVTMLLGEDPWVMHTDNGIKYTYNITKSMFSSGNISEKLRIANFDCSNEVIVDLFAGIGYFTLPYLVHAHAQYVHACEWNPHAVTALKQNLQLNGVANRCSVYEGDNRKVCPVGVADRVNLGLIPSSRDSWEVACVALKPTGGTLHIHANVESQSSTECLKQDHERERDKKFTKFSKTKPAKIEWIQFAEQTAVDIINILETHYGNKVWQTNVLHIEHVKSYAPHVDHIVIDVKCWAD